MTFQEWFNAEASAAMDTECGKAFVAAGFEFWHSGGYLTAWRKETPQGEYLASVNDSGNPANAHGAEWTIGLYPFGSGDPAFEGDWPSWGAALSELQTDILTYSAARLDDLDAACRMIQEYVGQDDGGIAGIVFSDLEDGQWQVMAIDDRKARLESYLETELNFKGE